MPVAFLFAVGERAPVEADPFATVFVGVLLDLAPLAADFLPETVGIGLLLLLLHKLMYYPIDVGRDTNTLTAFAAAQSFSKPEILKTKIRKGRHRRHTARRRLLPFLTHIFRDPAERP